MPDFEIPDSVRSYFSDRKVKAVVDALVSNLDDPPALPDMDRAGLGNLNEGVLLACQVRTDFVTFLAMLWEKSYGEALKRFSSTLSEAFDSDCTIAEVWGERHYWSFIHPRGGGLDGRHFDFTVAIGDKDDIELKVWYWNDDDIMEFPRKFGAPEGWARKRDRENDPVLKLELAMGVTEFLNDPGEGINALRSAAGKFLEWAVRSANLSG